MKAKIYSGGKISTKEKTSWFGLGEAADTGQAIRSLSQESDKSKRPVHDGRI